MWSSFLAVGAGAAVGAIARMQLGIWLNHSHHAVQLGTWVANLSGGYLIGIAAGVFSHLPGLAPEWRLVIITGFLGALTTFSSFSLEVVTLIQQSRHLHALLTVASHLIGSLLMTALGLYTVEQLRSAFS